MALMQVSIPWVGDDLLRESEERVGGLEAAAIMRSGGVTVTFEAPPDKLHEQTEVSGGVKQDPGESRRARQERGWGN